VLCLVLAVCLWTAGLVAVSPGALAAEPTGPGGVTASSITSSSATLRWTAATDDVQVIGYRVYRGPAGAPVTDLTLIVTLDAKVLSYNATALRSSYGYALAVAAIDADNNESPRAATTFSTLSSTDTTAPDPPGSSSVSARAFSSSRIDVTWGVPTTAGAADISFYEVLRNGAVVGTVDRPHSARFSDNGLSPSTAYSYTVRSVDSAGNRSTATTARSQTTMAAGVVKIVRGPYVVRADASSALVAWWTNIPSTGSVSVSGAATVVPSTPALHHEISL
jgi:chitin-binding protein